MWGFVVTSSTVPRLVLTFAAPLLAAFLWGRFVAPRSPRRLPDPLRLLVELVVFGAASGGLVMIGHEGVAVALAAVYVVNVTLGFVWHQRDY